MFSISFANDERNQAMLSIIAFLKIESDLNMGGTEYCLLLAFSSTRNLWGFDKVRLIVGILGSPNVFI